MAEDEKHCTLPKSARCCMMEYAGDEACTHCGWQPEERARRRHCLSRRMKTACGESTSDRSMRQTAGRTDFLMDLCLRTVP